MRKRSVVWFLLAAALSLLVSCGGGTQGTTVAATTNLDSDVLTGETFTNGVCDTSKATVLPDSVNVTITTLPQNSGTIQNPIHIDRVDVTFSRANTWTPDTTLLNHSDTMDLWLNPGASVIQPVRVVTHEMKTGPILSPLACSGIIYTYFATVHFHATDANGEVNIADTHLNVHFADFGG